DIAKLLTEDAKGGSGGTGGGASGVSQQRGFLSPRGSVSFDVRTNTLLVIDIPKKVAEIKQVVSLLDRPVDQVLIEARIVIATQSFARDLGARLGLSGAHLGDSAITSYGGNLESTLSTTNSIVATAATNAQLEATFQAALTTFNTCVAGGGSNCGAA